jgi:hypothetical protein
MMNDRFSSELRQHLLGTANERPAEGQLASVVERVAETPQRVPLVARLTWYPGRFGSFPTTALRYGLILALIAAMVAAVILGGGSPRVGGTVFQGTWTARDPADGSTQTLVVDAGTAPRVHYVDDRSTGAACVADAVKVFTADGTGTVVGNRLSVEWLGGGGCGLRTVQMDPGSYTYDEPTDVLVDGLAVVWGRSKGDVAPPTRGPLTQPTPARPAPSSQAVACVHLANGSTYTAPVGPLSVTATIPQRPANTWQGMPDFFYLSVVCDAVQPVGIFASTATDAYSTSCMPDIPWTASFAESIARLDTPRGKDISARVDLTIDGHPAARYDIANLTTCPRGFGLWHGTSLGGGETGSIYVIDVDGVLLAIELNRDGSQTPAELAEARAIVESLQISR